MGTGSKPRPWTSPSRTLPTELPEAKMPYVSLELEVRPRAAAGLIFHLGQAQATPSVQLQVLREQVSRAVMLDHSVFAVASGEQNLTVLLPRSCCGQMMGQGSSPRG